MSRFEELGRRLADVQDAEREALLTNSRSADSFIHALRQNRRSRSPRLLLVAALLATLAVLLLVRRVLVLEQAPSGPPALAVTPVRKIVVPRNQTIPMHFADGSRLLLAADTRATVRDLSLGAASVEIETGDAQFQVVHRAETRWTVRAGPYQVRVTGTKFALEWSPEADRFVLELSEGSVIVSSDSSANSGVKMGAPERLVIEQGIWRMSPLPTHGLAQAGNQAQAEPAEARPVGSAPAPLPRRLAPTKTPKSRALPSAWLSLGLQGKFAEAYDDAELLGIEHWARSSGAPELLALAEICRFSGHPQQATSVLTKLRARFPNGEESATAAFQLGRLTGEGSQAAEWFRTYLGERPSGALAREAAGRLLEVLDRSGNRADAKAAAETYLRRYPSGPHAAFAHEVLGP